MNKLSHNDLIQMGLRAFTVLLLAVVMGCFISLTSGAISLNSVALTCVLFAGIYLLSLVPLASMRNSNIVALLFAAAIAACLIYIRVCLLYYRSGDFTSFLSNWVETLRPLSVGQALSQQLGDYNVPYLYILTAISRTGADVLVSIKAVSCAFDVLLAYFVMKCVSLKTQDIRIQLTAYLLTLALPTVLLNGAWWGQCDSIFAAFCVGSLYYALRSDARASVIFWTLAFSFKLQAIFVLPALIIAYVVNKMKIRYLVWFPIVSIGMILPAVIAGRSFYNCISIYFNQASQYPKLFMNAPTIWRLVGTVEFDNFNMAAIFLAGAAVLLFMYLCISHGKGIGSREMIYIFYISAMLLPYLLPRMHDRYFFIADVLSLVLFFYDRKKWYVPVITLLASFVTYSAYGMGAQILDQIWVSVALLALLTVTIRDLMITIRKNEREVLSPVIIQSGKETPSPETDKGGDGTVGIL